MTARKPAPIWAIVSAKPAGQVTGIYSADPYADTIYGLTFEGEPAATLQVTYYGALNTTRCTIQFVEPHQGNDGAYITYLALKALYDNQAMQRARTGGSEDFEFPSEAFEFAGSLLTFEY